MQFLNSPYQVNAGASTSVSRNFFCIAGLVFTMALLQGCDGLSDQAGQISRLGETRIQVPGILTDIAKVDPDALILEVQVNDQPTVLSRGADDVWTGVVEVPVNQTSTVAVVWGQNYGSAGYIPLAEQRKAVFMGEQGSAITFNGGYSSGPFNEDNDAFSNLLEIQEGRSPTNFLDATINTDGAFPTGGISYPPSNECGAQMPVAVPIKSGGRDGAADLSVWWCATYLTGQNNGDSIRFVVNVVDDILFNDDPGREYQDDSIELYIDSNNSKRSFYDGVNDYQLRFVPNGSAAVFSGNSLPVPAGLTGSFIYFTGGYRLIATIPIASVGITSSQAFGFNVEVNDDDDGGDRDSKLGWIGIEDRDISWRNPSAFGTAQIP